ncbi:MAG: hypothetical protein A3J76_05265 [Candidatus Moranbacteria bacterium RBG_13_45_13]|nr:MAG: hypothetical protein A3J76_05265 [Candidatus Moranbacteria bacterium RBG_13_45_13]
MLKETVNLPSVIIDPHCHARDMDQSYKTTVKQTMAEAQKGLITTSFFMPNTSPPIVNPEVLERYLKIIDRAREELGVQHQQYVYFGATDENLRECRGALNNPAVVSIKVYPLGKSGETVTTGTIGVADDITILKLLNLSEISGKPVAFHCDDPEIISLEGNTIRAEVSYVKKILRMTRDFPQAKIIICHVSCIESAELILHAQERGTQVALELCPHYLWFDADGTNWNPRLNPVFYKCYNNLRPKEHREFLVSLLKMDNPLIFVGSDNAPHTLGEKTSRGFGGLSSNQEMVPVILTLARKLGLANQQVVRLLCFNAANFFQIPVINQMKVYRLEKQIDSLQYNNGVVENPWRGSELYFPVPVEE